MEKAKSRGKTNRRKGHNAERHYVNIFKDLGYDFCQTSRYGSRIHDNAKIDLIGLPFNIQIKAGKQKNMNPGKELFGMSMLISNMFPPEDNIHLKPNLIIHRKDGVKGMKRKDSDDLVYMTKSQFEKFKEKVPKFEFLFNKKARFGILPPFDEVVAVSFEYFKNKILTNKNIL